MPKKFDERLVELMGGKVLLTGWTSIQIRRHLRQLRIIHVGLENGLSDEDRLTVLYHNLDVLDSEQLTILAQELPANPRVIEEVITKVLIECTGSARKADKLTEELRQKLDHLYQVAANQPLPLTDPRLVQVLISRILGTSRCEDRKRIVKEYLQQAGLTLFDFVKLAEPLTKRRPMRGANDKITLMADLYHDDVLARSLTFPQAKQELREAGLLKSRWIGWAAFHRLAYETYYGHEDHREFDSFSPWKFLEYLRFVKLIDPAKLRRSELIRQTAATMLEDSYVAAHNRPFFARAGFDLDKLAGREAFRDEDPYDFSSIKEPTDEELALIESGQVWLEDEGAVPGEW